MYVCVQFTSKFNISVASKKAVFISINFIAVAMWSIVETLKLKL